MLGLYLFHLSVAEVTFGIPTAGTPTTVPTPKPGTCAGCYTNRSVDLEVTATAIFAVAAINNETALFNTAVRKPVLLVRVQSAATQVVAGMNFRLDMILVDAKGIQYKVRVYVFRPLPQSMKPLKLTQCTLLGTYTPTPTPGPSSQPCLGCYTNRPIDNDVNKAAAFAVQQINNATAVTALGAVKKPVTLVKVVSAQVQVVAGLNFKIDLLVKDSNNVQYKIQVVVYKPLALPSSNAALRLTSSTVLSSP